MDVTSATVGLRCEPEGVAVLGTVSQRDEVWWDGVGWGEKVWLLLCPLGF